MYDRWKDSVKIFKLQFGQNKRTNNKKCSWHPFPAPFSFGRVPWQPRCPRDVDYTVQRPLNWNVLHDLVLNYDIGKQIIMINSSNLNDVMFFCSNFFFNLSFFFIYQSMLLTVINQFFFFFINYSMLLKIHSVINK